MQKATMTMEGRVASIKGKHAARNHTLQDVLSPASLQQHALLSSSIPGGASTASERIAPVARFLLLAVLDAFCHGVMRFSW